MAQVCPRVGEPGRCFDKGMTSHDEVPHVVRASREIAASPGKIFELIADPAQQPGWDGNDNLAQARRVAYPRHR